MLHFLYKYLVLHRHASVPGVGSFNIIQSPALVNGNTITAPRQEISFSPGTALTDKDFYHFLSNESGMSEVDSVRKFQDFAYQLRKDIQSYPQVVLKGLGKLSRNGNGEIIFESSVSADKYFSSLILAGLSHSNAISAETPLAEEDNLEMEVADIVERRDRWGIWAIILAVLALAVIGYFYMQGEII